MEEVVAMRSTSKKYCRITVLMYLVISLCVPPVVVNAQQGAVYAANKAQEALRTKITRTWMDESIDKVLMDLADDARIDIVKSPKVTGKVTAKVTDVPLEEALANILAAHDYTYVATDNMIRVVPVSEIALAKEELVSKVYRITYADANEVAASLRNFVSEKGKVAVNRGTNHIVVTDTEQKIKAVDKFITELDRQTQQVLVDVKIYEITTREGFDLEGAMRAARVIPLEAQGVVNPTTTTTTVTPGYTTTTAMARDELPHNTSDTTVTPEYTTTTTVARDELAHNTSESTIRSGTDPFTESITRTDPGADRTDRTTVTMPEITTTNTHADPGADRTDTTTVTMPDITSTETTVQQSPTGYYTRKRGKPFVGGSFDRARGGTLSFSLLNDAVDFEFALSMLKKQVEAKLLANPRILVLDNETADFGIIREVPYRELLQVSREAPMTYTEFKDVGVQLKVTPHIARDGVIKLHVIPEFGVLVSQNAISVLRGQDNAGRDMYQTVLGVPTVDTRRADTVALIKDGQTIAIGGLRKRQTSKDISKVPVIGDIPLIGNLFRSSSESVEISELVVLITPRIIGDPQVVAPELSEDGENGIPKAFREAQKPKELPQATGESARVDTKATESTEAGSLLAERGPNVMMQLAYAHLKMQRYDLAKDVLTSVIERKGDDSTTHQYLGYCYLKLGDLDKAIDSYGRAVELNDADWEAHRGLGVAYMLKARSTGDEGLAAKAIEQWRKSLDIKPDQKNAQTLVKMIETYSQ
jgi:type II secretory pathway component GspD/PulD (secretin)